MKRISKMTVMISLATLVLLSGIAWGYGYLADCRSEAQGAASDFAACKVLAAQIESLRRKPVLAVSRELQVTEFSRRLEDALAKSEIPTEDLVRVSPEPARRVNDTAYLERSTQLTLHDVTLRQIILFMTSVASEGSGLSVGSFRLTAPRNSAAEGEWAVEIGVSYLVFSPKSEPAAVRMDARSDSGNGP